YLAPARVRVALSPRVWRPGMARGTRRGATPRTWRDGEESPRDFRLLSRQRSRAGMRRRTGRRRPGGALFAQEARRPLPPSGRRLVPGRGWTPAERPRRDRLLRQAVGEVRAHARNLSRLCAARAALVPDRDAGLAEGKAQPAHGAQARTRRPRRRPAQGAAAAALHRASSGPRRLGFLREPLLA